MSVDTTASMHAPDDAQATGSPRRPDFAFADHGHRMALLAVYRPGTRNATTCDTPHNVLSVGGLSSY